MLLDKCNYKKIQKKRLMLPFVGVFLILSLEDIQTFIYVPVIVSFGSFIIFWNFPILAYYNSTKPLYVKDLFVDTSKLPNYDVDPKIKKKFLKIFEWSIIISASLLCGALADFWLYKTTGNETWIEIVGITGGILKIYQMIDWIVGHLILKIIRRYIIKESSRLKKKRYSNLRRIIRLKIIQHNINRTNMIYSNSNESLSTLVEQDGNNLSIN